MLNVCNLRGQRSRKHTTFDLQVWNGMLEHRQVTCIYKPCRASYEYVVSKVTIPYTYGINRLQFLDGGVVFRFQLELFLASQLYTVHEQQQAHGTALLAKLRHGIYSS